MYSKDPLDYHYWGICVYLKVSFHKRGVLIDKRAKYKNPNFDLPYSITAGRQVQSYIRIIHHIRASAPVACGSQFGQLVDWNSYLAANSLH
jgi:hypothetical protein